MNFLKDICRILGHEGVEKVTHSPQEMVMILGGICTRCSAGSVVRVRYSDLYYRGSSVLEKAQRRLKESLDS